MHELVQFVLRHGYVVLFGWVLAEQAGVPVPAVPILMAAGALAGTGQMSLGKALALAAIGCVIADSLWFYLGRYRGRQMLGLLCKMSLEPDSCVRRTENLFERHGAKSLLVAKFIPGFSTAAPPMAGVVRMNFARFLIFDLAGSLIWAGAFAGAGFLFAHQLEDAAMYVSQLGNWLVALLGAALTLFVAWKWRERRKFLQDLSVARIGVSEVKRRMDAGERLTIVDLRHTLDVLVDPRTIPGALHIPPELVETRHGEITRDGEVILFCT